MTEYDGFAWALQLYGYNVQLRIQSHTGRMTWQMPPTLMFVTKTLMTLIAEDARAWTITLDGARTGAEHERCGTQNWSIPPNRRWMDYC